MIELLWKYSQLVTLRVAQFFFHDNASPAGMRDRSKVKKTVPAQGTLETKHFEKPTTQSYSRNALAFAELIMRWDFIDEILKKNNHTSECTQRTGFRKANNEI